MKLVSQSRAEKLAKLYEAASEIIHRQGDYSAEEALVFALKEIDGGECLADPMQVLEGD